MVFMRMKICPRHRRKISITMNNDDYLNPYAWIVDSVLWKFNPHFNLIPSKVKVSILNRKKYVIIKMTSKRLKSYTTYFTTPNK